MKLTATEFRKRLFSVLEQVLDGEPTEITYKSRTIRLTAAEPAPASKFANLKKRPGIITAPDHLLINDEELTAEMLAEAEKDWERL